MIAIATLSDWLKRLAPVFQPMRCKTKTNRTMYAWFSCASSELQVICGNCDWFIALAAPVVIGRSSCFGFGLSTVIWKPLYDPFFVLPLTRHSSFCKPFIGLRESVGLRLPSIICFALLFWPTLTDIQPTYNHLLANFVLVGIKIAL